MLTELCSVNSGLWPHETTINVLLWLVPGLALLCWRFWRFTISPYLNPSEPKLLPYWIPCHVRPFFKNYNTALDEASKYFRGSTEPYGVWIAGVHLYICTSPEDVANLYRNTTTISFHTVVKEMHEWIGVTKDGIQKLFLVDQAATHNIGRAHPQAPAFMMIEYHRLHTSPGELFDDLMYKRFIPGINQALDAVADGSDPSVLRTTSDSVTVSLLGLSKSLFLRVITTLYLGQKIWEVNPTLLDSFIMWERTNWKYMFHMPDIISKDMLQARDDIINTFVTYIRIPENERADSNGFIKSTEAMLREAGCNERDMAIELMLHFWVVLGNIYKVAFWTLAHLAYNRSLLETIINEISPAIQNGRLDESYLAEKGVLLESLISEVLRVTVATALVRDVVKPTNIRGKILQPGAKILVPYRQLHSDRLVWGQNPFSLEPNRFAKDPKLYSSKSYRPFGGGNTLCPGRFFAKRAMGYAIASIITIFDVRIDTQLTRKALGEVGKDSDQAVGFPRIDHSKPTPGASLPVKGEDVFLVLQQKQPEEASRG